MRVASLTGRRNWPREGRQPVRDADGFGLPRPWRDGGQIRPNSERVPRPWRDGLASLTGQTRQGRVLRRIFVGSPHGSPAHIPPPVGGPLTGTPLRAESGPKENSIP